jgi:ABC-2 type transport system ATP-binding protein
MLARPAMVEAVVTLRELVKSYGKVQALRGLTLELPPGPVGLLGPNGAGKTTLIKLLLGLLESDGGEARILGFDPSNGRDCVELRRRVGYMPESDCLPAGTSAVELITALGRITGLSPADAMTRAHEALDYVGLDEARYREMSEYSTGMKQRVKLAQALAHDPPLLLLDEPTNGLDPKGRRHMLELVHDLGHAQKKHVLLCSHLLPDVERTCDHIVVLDRGRAIKSGAIAELTRVDGRSIRVRVGGDVERFTAALSTAALTFERDEDGALIVGTRGEDADELFALAASSSARIEAVEEIRASLDEVFLSALHDAQGAAK